MFDRSKTRRISIGGVTIGGGAPVRVQTMTNTRTKDVAATVRQIKELVRYGAELVRISIPDCESAEAIPAIKRKVDVPLIADIHFDPALAELAIDRGIDALRINPGNIRDERLTGLIAKAKKAATPIRVGVNAGSLEKDLLESFGSPTPEALVVSAGRKVRLLESFGFDLIKVSIKAHDPVTTLAANRRFAEEFEYPLHIGITEAGPLLPGTVKSAVGLGLMLHEGLGDTLRVSLTDHPKHEVVVGYEILRALGMRRKGVEIVSCPTCARTETDIIGITKKVVDRLKFHDSTLTVAIMGCVVNGPGEAREADIGVACGKSKSVLFAKGKPIGTIRNDAILERLLVEVERLSEKD